jgi:hypothetical protein
MLPENIRRTIPPLHSKQEASANPTAYARLIRQLADGTTDMIWYILELDKEDQDTFLAYMFDNKGERYGYYAFSYLEDTLSLEYDPDFIPKPLIEAIEQEHEALTAWGKPIPPGRFHRPYYYAARYNGEHSEALSKQAYTTIEQIPEPVELSAQRLLANEPFGWYVVVFGDRPPQPVHNRITQALSTGELTTIPFELLAQLLQNRAEELQRSQGERVEQHRNIVFKRKKPQPKKKRPHTKGRGNGRRK